MRFLAVILGVAMTLAAMPMSVANAAQPPRVEAYQCSYLAGQVGAANVWQTWFRGQRTDLFDRTEGYVAAPCFHTEANCKAWLYWAQSDWPDHNTFQPCRKGIVY